LCNFQKGGRHEQHSKKSNAAGPNELDAEDINDCGYILPSFILNKLQALAAQ
jgi:hypothetical protein